MPPSSMRHLLLTALALLALLLLLTPPSLVHADDVDTSHLPTYYTLLELSPTSTPADVKKSYRRLALIHHPDKATSPSDRTAKEAAFIQLSDAYEVLSSTTLRPRYDYLLTQGVHVYSDAVRDWASFNAETGKFDRKGGARGEVVFGDGRFSFGGSRSWEDARERWEREQGEEEAEKRALLLALLGSVGVALLPLGWFYAQRAREWWEAARRKSEASEKLRGEQAALTEWQEERKKEEERMKAEHRARIAEIKRMREEAAAAAEAEGEDEEDEVVNGVDSQPNASPVLPGTDANGEPSTGDAAQLAAAAVDAEEEEEDERPRKGGGGALLSCDECRKKFKSSAQLENHLGSNQHKKAVKDSQRRAGR